MFFVATFFNNYTSSVIISVPKNYFRLNYFCVPSREYVIASSSSLVELFVFSMMENIYNIFCPYLYFCI